MASRFWVGGAGTWDSSTTTHWAATTGGASGASAPTSADTATFDTSSGLTNGLIVTITSTAACSSWTVTMGAVKTIVFALSGDPTFTGAISITGNSNANRVYVQSNTPGTARTLSASSTTLTDVDFMDITATGAAAWSGTRIGDAGGNTGITATTPAAQTWSGTSGGNWSTNAWTTRVPLPQDNVTISSAFIATQTVTCDMPRLGASINWTGATGSPTWAFSSTPNTIFGSVTLIAGMSISGTQALTFGGRTTMVLTSAGRTLTMPVSANPGTATLQLADDFNSSNTVSIGSGFQGGVLDTQSHNMTQTTHIGAFGITATYGTSTITMTSTAAVTVFSQSATFSNISAANATFVIAGATANTRSFLSGGYTYGTLNYTVAGSTGILAIGNAPVINNLVLSDATNARTVTVSTAGLTVPDASGLRINGTAGKLTTISSNLGGSAFPFTVNTGSVSCNFLSLKDCTATGNTPFYAGGNSTDVSGNSGWIFATKNLFNKGVRPRPFAPGLAR